MKDSLDDSPHIPLCIAAVLGGPGTNSEIMDSETLGHQRTGNKLETEETESWKVRWKSVHRG